MSYQIKWKPNSTQLFRIRRTDGICWCFNCERRILKGEVVLDIAMTEGEAVVCRDCVAWAHKETSKVFREG